MKSLFTLLFIVAFAMPSSAQKVTFKKTAANANNTATTTYYFIRHAEKDRSDKTNRNPELTETGLERAKHWSEILQHVKFDAVFSTDYNRTKQTATPTAIKNDLEVSIYDPRTLYSDEFKKLTMNKTVLVVGHSNTTPAFVNRVLGQKKYDDIDDTNNGNLYILTISEGKIIDQVLTIN